MGPWLVHFSTDLRPAASQGLQRSSSVVAQLSQSSSDVEEVRKLVVNSLVRVSVSELLYLVACGDAKGIPSMPTSRCCGIIVLPNSGLSEPFRLPSYERSVNFLTLARRHIVLVLVLYRITYRVRSDQLVL